MVAYYMLLHLDKKYSFILIFLIFLLLENNYKTCNKNELYIDVRKFNYNIRECQ